MTCRTETGVTYLQTYNAENRIASIQKLASGTCAAPGNLTAKWDFTYDGDGVRTGQSYTPYTNRQPGSVVITRYYFGGALETQGSTVKKYYSFAGQAVAMKDASGFNYFLSDHLGSISVVLKANGNIEQQRYLPFGGARVMPPYSGVTSTDFTYTGQRALPNTGLMDYKARFYSPALGRFIQPDTIIPDLPNPQSWNRFSYVRNNPLRYSDPTGHRECDDGSDCRSTVKTQIDDLKLKIKNKFKWNIKGKGWTRKELQTIYQTGLDIKNYADGITGGNSLDWMHSAFGNTTIEHGYHADGHSDAMPFLGENFGARIRLDRNWLTNGWGPKVVFAHELGHVWDINSGFAASGQMNKDLGGSSSCYFCAPGDGVPRWAKDYHSFNGDAYGNSARNEYFAEAFSATIYNPTKTPFGVSDWINFQMLIDVSNYIAPGAIQ
jgi:RHS repeat-associated protein